MCCIQMCFCMGGSKGSTAIVCQVVVIELWQGTYRMLGVVIEHLGFFCKLMAYGISKHV